jgi:FdhE protein
MSDHLAASIEFIPVQARLNTLSHYRPDLASACACYSELLPILKEAQHRAPALNLDPRRAQQKLDQGKPVLRGVSLPFSTRMAQDLLRQICEAIAGSAAAKPPAARSLRRACGASAGLPLVTLMDALLTGSTEPLARAARQLDLDPVLLRVVVDNCLKPFLMVWAGQLAEKVDVTQWRRGWCPFCGGAPLFAELHGPERARSLRCGRCGADWPFNQLKCVHCGTTDLCSLGVLQLDSHTERGSVQTCSACHTYIKMLVTSEPTCPEQLMVEDLSSITLDWIAGQYGYTRPG